MARRGGIGAHQSAAAASVEWATPPHVIAALGGAEAFALDPCAALLQPWPCGRRSFTLRENGLRQKWDGPVYMNPPYGDSIAEWLYRLSEHGDGIALVFNRSETDAFFEGVWGRASAMLVLRGRLFFHFAAPFVDKHGKAFNVGERAPANGGAPSILLAYGAEQAERLRRCGLAGFFVDLRHGMMIG